MADKAKLVYTTDKRNPSYADNMVGISGSMNGSEAIVEMGQSIRQMKKSQRRYCIMPHRKAQNADTISDAKRKEFSWVVNHLFYHKKATRAELAKLLPGHNLKYLDNLMQTIRLATHPYIQSKGGFWAIQEDCKLDSEALINLAIANRGNRNSRRNQKPAAAPEPDVKKGLDDDLHEEFFGDVMKGNRIVVDGNKPIEIEIKTGGTSIVIKIG